MSVGVRSLSRRQFLCRSSLLFGSAIFADDPGAFGATYDLIIKGGRVIDPSQRLDAVQDVAISGRRITAIHANLASSTAQVVDATGKLVVPGLLDIHTHCARTIDSSFHVLQDGVTGWIDAGTCGADHIHEAAAAAQSAPQLARVLINIGREGLSEEGDTMDLSLADVSAAKAAISKHRNFIVGVKARLSRDVAGANDYEVLRRAQEVASSFNLPVMIHMGQTISPIGKLVGLLKRGDIVTHMFAPPPNSIIDDKGNILPEVVAARKRGVWFDVGNGRTGHMRWDTIAAIMKAGFWPDTFSTDWNPTAHYSGVIDLPNCMSKLFNYGMTVSEAIARATLNPARIFPFMKDRGTLKTGAPADIAILDLREGKFEFLDNYNNKITGTQRLFPSKTILAGKVVASGLVR